MDIKIGEKFVDVRTNIIITITHSRICFGKNLVYYTGDFGRFGVVFEENFYKYYKPLIMQKKNHPLTEIFK